MRDVPDLSFETIKRMEDMTWFTHAQIFDDLLIVSHFHNSRTRRRRRAEVL
jgi:hypothetical protein